MTTANDNHEEGAVAIPNIHQSRADDHDRLGFHPDCPVCREDRLFGALAPEPTWSRRARVLLAAGVLVLSASATATSVASEPDNQQEGVVVPDPSALPPGAQAGGAPPPDGDGPGQGSGGETSLPSEVDPVLTEPESEPTGGQSEDAAPLEAVPVDDPEGRLTLSAPPAPPESDPGALGESDPMTDAPVPPAVPTEPAPPASPEPPTAPPLDPGAQAEPESARPTGDAKQPHDKGGARHERHSARKKARDRSRGELSPGNPAAADTPATETSAPGTAAGTAPPPEAAPAPQLGSRRLHLVRPGESLWSIASAQLGPGASPAAIALQVRRLWRLNEAQIGTGDPNLLPIGVRLQLR